MQRRRVSPDAYDPARARILFEILAPPLVASLLYVSIAAIFWNDTTFVRGFLGLIAFAYLFAGVPSLGFAAVMEASIRRGMRIKSWAAVGLAAALGLVGGCFVAVLFNLGAAKETGAFALFGGLGLATGVIMSVCLIAASRKPVDDRDVAPGATN